MLEKTLGEMVSVTTCVDCGNQHWEVYAFDTEGMDPDKGFIRCANPECSTRKPTLEDTGLIPIQFILPRIAPKPLN